MARRQCALNPKRRQKRKAQLERANATKALPSGHARSVWDSSRPRGQRKATWDYDGVKAGVIHKRPISIYE